MDDSYLTYVNRLVRMTLPEAYRSQLPKIQTSPKFYQGSDQRWHASAFPGYTIITPPWSEDPDNTACYELMQQQQSQLVAQLEPDLLLPVPPDSFHVTLADLIWNDAYSAAAENPGFEALLQQHITTIFAEVQPLVSSVEPIRWQALGLLVMPRAVAVALAPASEDAYDPIIKLRRALYQSPELIALGIEQQYYLTAHVTLGYFGKIPDQLAQDADFAATFTDQLTALLSELNQQWQDGSSYELVVKRAELRKFDTMMHYYRQSTWPMLEF